MFWYMASPYSKFTAGIEAAFQAAAAQAALLVRAGVPVYSPIAHTHPVAIHGGIDPYDHTIWLEADRTFMEAACGLIVCKLPGWESSYGIQVEVEHFTKAGKPICYMEPGEVPAEVLPSRRQIIALCGYARAGKDSAAAGLEKEGWTRVAFADAVRESVLALNPGIRWRAGDSAFQKTNHLLGSHIDLKFLVGDCGWDDAKQVGDVRTFLQRMGTEAGRNIHGDDCWIRIAKRKIDAAPGNVVITDCRFANEAEAVRSWGGKVIRIDRPGVGPVNGHASEELAFEPDETILNDGTIEQLQLTLSDAVAGREASNV